MRTAGISLEKLNPLNRASPSHVIGALVNQYDVLEFVFLGFTKSHEDISQWQIEVK